MPSLARALWLSSVRSGLAMRKSRDRPPTTTGIVVLLELGCRGFDVRLGDRLVARAAICSLIASIRSLTVDWSVHTADFAARC
ncbi:hypothetical protein HD806DRAFT_507541 [Xylariaceae sp. AK1471]|nr:hypothetical protein HD806DRAFT_507541 [Xylariaceae sp. AK1471]